MTPAARIQAAIEILDALDKTAMPADRMLRDWFRTRHFMGSKDRAAVSERVYGAFRHRAFATWRMRADTARALVIGSLLHEPQTPDAVAQLFSAGAYGPSPLTDDEQTAIAHPPPEPPPLHVQGEFPPWLEPELTRAFGDELLDEMHSLQSRAPVDLRVNTLRASRHDMLVGLRSLGVNAEPAPYAPQGIRIPSAEKLSALQQTQFFQTGAFEFQDESSQIAAVLCDVKPGQSVLDLAAGAGGKSLALAAAMQNKGSILAFDSDAGRLRQIGPRARRAGAHIILAAEQRDDPVWGDGKFDVVLVDSPCTGSGAWRRTPESKWRLTPERLRELNALQAWLIDDGARHTKPGGRLVYATCSLLPCENADIVDAFLARNPAFHPISAAEIWTAAVGTPPPPGTREKFTASPRKTGTDGFFVCIMAAE